MGDHVMTLGAVLDRKVGEAIEKNRLKVLDPEKAEEVLTAVFECARGQRDMSATELRAAEIYLRKCVPDLKAVEVSGSLNLTLEQLVLGSMKEADVVVESGPIIPDVVDVQVNRHEGITPQDDVIDKVEEAVL